MHLFPKWSHRNFRTVYNSLPRIVYMQGTLTLLAVAWQEHWQNLPRTLHSLQLLAYCLSEWGNWIGLPRYQYCSLSQSQRLPLELEEVPASPLQVEEAAGLHQHCQPWAWAYWFPPDPLFSERSISLQKKKKSEIFQFKLLWAKLTHPSFIGIFVGIQYNFAWL